MSKAEERALEAYPSTSHYWNAEPDRNAEAREFYKQGYHQAEKDLELTWEDMRLIDKISSKLLLLKGDLDDKGFFQEVLERFKDFREKKREMKTVIITCDRCGKEITNDINGFPHYLNNINLNLHYWHGGSMGGEEDVDRLHCEICGDCARSLYYTFKKWIERKEK